mgnify:CR=1 FL=1
MSKGLSALRQVLFLVSVPIFFVSFAIPVQAKQLGASAVEIGALFSLFTISLIVLRPLVGSALDRFGRKPFVVVSMAVYCMANMFFAFAEDVNAMYVARLLQGIGASLLLIGVDTITADLTAEHERAVAMGKNIEMQTRATFVGAMIGFWLLGAMPIVAWKYTFGLYALMAFCAFFVAFFRLPETKSGKQQEHSGPFKIVPALRRLLLIVFLSGFANALIQPLYLIYLQDKFALPTSMLVWAFLPSGIIFAILPSKLGQLSSLFGNIRVMVVSLSIPGLLYLFLVHLDLFVSFVVFYTIATVAWAAFDPARKSLAAEFSAERTRGRVFGVVELYYGIGASMGPIVGGYIYDTGSAALAFYGNGALLLATTLLASIILVPAESQK